jgi:hypothetical protein
LYRDSCGFQPHRYRYWTPSARDQADQLLVLYAGCTGWTGDCTAGRAMIGGLAGGLAMIDPNPKRATRAAVSMVIADSLNWTSPHTLLTL